MIRLWSREVGIDIAICNINAFVTALSCVLDVRASVLHFQMLLDQFGVWLRRCCLKNAQIISLASKSLTGVAAPLRAGLPPGQA